MVFAGDLDPDTVGRLLDRWCARAQRSRIPEFVKAGRTIRKHRDGIDAAINRGLSNGRHEGLNNKVRLIIRRAYGFHTPQAALAAVMLACGPAKLELPYHTPNTPPSTFTSIEPFFAPGTVSFNRSGDERGAR